MIPRIPWDECKLEAKAWLEQAHQLFRAQPAIPLGMAFLWGTIGVVLSPTFGTLGGMATFYLNRRNPFHWQVMVGSAFLLAAFNGWWQSPLEPSTIPKKITEFASESIRDTAIITQFPLREKPALCAVELKSGQFGGEGWALEMPPGKACPEPGSRIAFTWEPRSQKGATVPGGFDARDWFRRQGLCRVRAIRDMEILSPPKGRWLWALRLRESLGQVFSRFIPESQQALVRSTVLGDMRALSQQTKIDFQNTGMLQILAISGQHIALMVVIAMQCFQFERLPPRWVGLILAVFLIFYGPATGNSPSVVRSIWMYGFLLPPLLLRKPLSPYTTLSLTATLSLALEPELITHVGWQLSYSATLLLLLHARESESYANAFYPFLIDRMPWLKNIPGMGFVLKAGTAAVLLSSIISFGTLPLLAASSHVFMPVTPIANLLTVPLGSGLLTCAFLTCLLSPLPVLPHWMGAATGFFAHSLTSSVHALAQWKSGLWAISTWPIPLFASWLFAFLIFPTLPKKSRRWFLIACGVALSWMGLSKTLNEAWEGQIRAIVVDVGQGSALLMEMGGKVLLVDAGPQKPDAGFRAILPTLRAWGHQRIDVVLLSHGDADHIGGLASLVEQVPIGKVALGSVWPKDGLWPNLESTLKAKGIPYGRLASGESILSFRQWQIRTLDLGALDSTNRNNASAIIALEGPTGRLVIPGDIEAGTERLLADTVQGWNHDRPLWLVIPHHGSDRTGDTASLSRMRPDWAFISAGEKNRFGHPGPQTVATLKNQGAKIGMTSKEGSWILTIHRNQAHWSPYQVVN